MASNGREQGGNRRLVYGVLLVVTLVGAVVRVSYLDAPMRWDEARLAGWVESWRYARVVSDYNHVGNHILHTLVVAATHALFGAAPWSVRLPSLLAGIALIPATFLTASTLFSRWIALLAAGLVAGSPYLTFYSINARGYSLQCLLVVILPGLLVRLVEAPARWSTVVAGMVGALALYALPTAVFVLPGIYLGIALWAAWGQGLPAYRAVIRTMVPALLVTGGATFIFYLPAVFGTGLEALTTDRYTAAQPAAEAWQRFGRQVVETLARWTWDLPFSGRVLFGAVAVVGVVSLLRRCASSGLAVLLILTTAPVVSLALQRVPPVRGYLFLMPFFLILLAAGIQALLEWVPTRRVALSPLMAALLAVGGMAWTWSSGWIEASDETGRIAGAEAAVEALATVMGPRDRVAPQFPQLRYYARLNDLPVRFADGTLNDPILEGVDRVYVVVRKHRETLRETLDQRLGSRTRTLDAFDAPRLFGDFPDLRVFVMSRRPDV